MKTSRFGITRLALALVVTFALAGTSAYSAKGGKPPKDNSGAERFPVKVTLLDNPASVPEYAALLNILTPRVTSDGQGSYVDGESQVEAMVGGNTAPDVILVELKESTKRVAGRKLNMDLSKLVDPNNPVSPAKPFIGEEGEPSAVGVPVHAQFETARDFPLQTKDWPNGPVEPWKVGMRFWFWTESSTKLFWQLVYGADWHEQCTNPNSYVNVWPLSDVNNDGKWDAWLVWADETNVAQPYEMDVWWHFVPRDEVHAPFAMIVEKIEP